MIDVGVFGGIDFHAKTGLQSCVRRHTGFKPFPLKQRLTGPKTAVAFWREPRRSKRGRDIVKALKNETADNPEFYQWIKNTAMELMLVIEKTGADAVVVHPWCHWITREIAKRSTRLPVVDLGTSIQANRVVFFTLAINNTWKRTHPVIDDKIRSSITPTYDLVTVFNTK